MSTKWTTKKDMLPDMIEKLKGLNGKSVEIGVFDGEHAWLASIHEYGCTIKPKNSQFLTVPINPKAKGKSAKDFPNAFVLESKSGELFIAVEKGKDQLELLFWLTRSVKIPERSFIRSGHDNCADEVLTQAGRAISKLLDGSLSEKEFFDLIGRNMSTKIKKFARSLSSPGNSSATTAVKKSSNPLVDTGSMINSITWRLK